MNSITHARNNLLTLKRHALLVFLICYIPLITTQPAWLFILFLSVFCYRLLEDYYGAPATAWWLHLILVIVCLFLLSRNLFISGFFIRFLLTFIILKYLEVRSQRDIKILILCNFFVILSALIVTQELWIIGYLLIAIIANLSIMLKLSAPEVSLTQISGKSGLQLLVLIPLSLILFYIFPRIDPLWQMRSLAKINSVLSDKMSPGSIAELFHDDSTTMQVTFTRLPVLRGYWRGVILNYYTGETWYSGPVKPFSFVPLNEIKDNETPDYEILLEPTHMRWLFYLDYPVAAKSNLLFAPDHGLTRKNKQPVTDRFGYSLKVQAVSYQPLSRDNHAKSTQLPNDLNPRLSAWSKEQFAKLNNDPAAFIEFLHQYIQDQPFWYSLKPPLLNANLNQMDSFWFDTKKGFCEHYASAVTFILRAAGIPARVILGYYGGQWNPITNSITIKQYNAHAWLEYWQEGVGWKLVDPTTFISRNRIEDSIQARLQEQLDQAYYYNSSTASWWQQISLFADSVRFYSERWFLFYNQNTQKNLLQLFGLGGWSTGKLLQASVICIPIIFILIGIYYSYRQRRHLDSLLYEYRLLQNEFRKLNIATPPSATLNQQCNALISKSPALAETISLFIERYQELRLKQYTRGDKFNKKQTILLFKKLRNDLRNMSVNVSVATHK